MGEFVRIDVTSSAQDLADQAVDGLRVEWPGYTPNEGDPEVVIIETLAPMAQNANETAARIPDTLFNDFGTKLYGVPYEAGTAASTTVTFAIADTDPHLIPAGTEVDIDGYAFSVNTDTATAALSVAGVPVTCTTIGADASGLTGATVAMGSGLTFVTGVTVDTPTTGGVDPEDQSSYLDRFSRALQLRAKTLVTLRDFELMATDDPEVARAVARRVAARDIEVTLIGPTGLAVSSDAVTRVEDAYADAVMANTTVTIVAATYTAVSVTYTVHPYPGYVAADVVARTTAALTDALSPGVFGRPRIQGEQSSVSTTWLPETVVRKNKLIDIAGDVEGVDYVGTLTITGAAGSGDLTLTGAVPLPTPGTISGTPI